ncbi:MAG: metal-dependent transcriptional regulator [Flavobacteriia bacterium]|nr:metal-dependent transcriptional regulator [Flavobacteriia bacterium]OJX36072.1 MAG: iron (metal) dependent repressor, dtxr family protein [Flavobacteriia bacterium 40-80]
MNSLTEENYLKAMFTLTNEKGEVNVNDLSKHLNIKMPTVTSMMKKLAAKELVDYQSYKPLRLTESGKKEAALIIRKHRLTEMFLVEKMGFGWESVHEIAEQVEHVRSPEFFDKMDEILGHPKIDPHGSPIPDKDGNIVWKEYLKLSECVPDTEVRLSAVMNSSEDFLRFLNSKELHLGLTIRIHSIEPFDQTMIVSYDNKMNEVLSSKVTERLLVEKLMLP